MTFRGEQGSGAAAGAHRAVAVVHVDRLRVHLSRHEPARRAGEEFGHRWCHMWSDDIEALQHGSVDTSRRHRRERNPER